MKNILFFLFILNSFVFAFNPATDKLVQSGQSTACRVNTEPYNSYFEDGGKVYIYTNEQDCQCCQTAGYNFVYNKSYTKTTYNIYTNYSGCPSGQEIINGSCAVPPSCPSGQIWDSSTDSCKSAPAADSDGDGIPDKCDKDATNYSSLDCDSDGIPNSTDNDIDGDGVPNENDANPNDPNNTTSCPVNSYTMIPGASQSECVISNSKFSAPNTSLYYTAAVFWDSCRNMCSAKFQNCPRGQAIKDGQCRSVEPDIGDCVGTSSCRTGGTGISDSNGSNYQQSCYKTCYCLTNSSPVPNSSNAYFTQEVACTDNLTDRDRLGDLRSQNESNSTTPNAPFADSNGTVNYDFAESFKAALDNYGGSKESTSQNLLTESRLQSSQLVTANTNLGNINSNLENFSNAATMNQGVINTTLTGIKDGQNIGNGLLLGIKDGVDRAGGLLEDIKNALDDNGSSDGNGTSYTESAQQKSDRLGVDEKVSSGYQFLTNVSNDFTNLKNMLDGGLPAPSISHGTPPTFCAIVFGRQLCINLCDSFGHFYGVFYYIFTFLFMFAALRIYYHAFKMRV